MGKRFPHLLKEDIELWEQFLDSPHNLYDHFDYDIQVGDGRDPGQQYPEHIRDMALNISRRRIDAVGIQPDALTIIEISISAGLTQLGQLLAYPCLYQITYSPNLPLKRLLIAQSIQTDIEPVLLDQKIPFVVLPLPEA